MKRNCKIELMRFVFAIVIVIFHINDKLWSNTKLIFPDSTWSFFAHGNIGVEFFFLLSGFLMARSIFKIEEAKLTCPSQNSQDLPIGDETLCFIWNKIKAFLPYHIFFNFLAIIIAVFRSDITDFANYILKCIPSFFFLGKTGLFNGNAYIGDEWYISAMLLMMAVIYPLARRFYASYTHMFGPLAAVFILGYIYMENGKLGGINEWNGFTYFAVFRAFAEITLGMTCFEVYRKMGGCDSQGCKERLLL